MIKLFRNKKGFSLIETLVVLAIFASLSYMIMQSYTSTITYTTGIQNEIKVQNDLTYTMSSLRREIRVAASVSPNINVNGCSYMGTSIIGECNSIGQLSILDASGSTIGSISLSSSNNLRYNASGSTTSVPLNSSSVSIKSVYFFYDNYDYTGAPSYSASSSYTLPYLNIIIIGCYTSSNNSLSNIVFANTSNNTCLPLFGSATEENYIYNGS